MVYKVVDSTEKLLSKTVSIISPLIAQYVEDGTGLEYAIGEMTPTEGGFELLESFNNVDDPILIALLYLHAADPKYLGSGLKSKGRRKLLKAAIPLMALGYCSARVINGGITQNAGEISQFLAYMTGVAAMGYRNLEDEYRNTRGYQQEEFFHQRAGSFLEKILEISLGEKEEKVQDKDRIVDRSAEVRRQQKKLGYDPNPLTAKKAKRTRKTKTKQ